MTISPTIRRALRTIILTQCLGMISILLMGNGFMLAYLSRLGIPGHRILSLLSLTPMINMLLTLPLAYVADRHGKKRTGIFGLSIAVIGFALFPIAGFHLSHAVNWACSGIVIFSMGSTIGGASWFALLSPIIPKEICGRFFGKLRMTFQTVSILFSLGIALLLHKQPTVPLFQLILTLVTILTAARILIYRKIPELEPEPAPRAPFRGALGTVLRIPNYLPFCSYIFLFTLFIGTVPWLAGLLQKEVLGYSDSQLVIQGNLLAVGTVIGFYFGGKLVDAFSTKPVFVIGHIAAAGVLFTLVLRNLIPVPELLTVSTFSVLLGVIQGATGIATSSEMMALIPRENKSLSTGLLTTLWSGGIACSGLLSAQVLKWKLLQPEWLLGGQTVSHYDTLLLGSAVMLVLLLVTLGLVPSVLGIHSQWVPQNR